MGLEDWVGRRETATDQADPAAYRWLAGILDYETPPWRMGEAPPLGHWLHFLAETRQGEIGPDGHPRRGGFLPPAPLPRRMWAGSRLTFFAPIPLSAAIVRNSTIKKVESKFGRSGEMMFVTIHHEVSVGGVVAVSEDQDVVYREAAKLGESPSRSSPIDAPAAEWTRTITPDPTLLFRYSALTYNGHRIHYDRNYCSDIEGYPGLVVHGPLVATLLLDHYSRRRPGARVAGFDFRAESPLFDLAPFDLNGRETAEGAELWATGPDGSTAMRASVTLAESL